MNKKTPSVSDMDSHLVEILANLNEIGATINRIGPRDDLSVEARLGRIVGSVIQVVPGSSAVLYLYDETNQRFDPGSRISVGETGMPFGIDEPRPDGLGSRAIDQRRRVLSYEEGDFVIHPVKVAAGAKIVACFPLIVAEEAVGALYVYLHEERPFTRLELLMLDNFVNLAAMALYQTRRFSLAQQDLARKEDELSRLRRAGLLISSRLRLEETLDAILQMALEVTNAHYGIFRLVDKTGRYLITRAFAGEGLARPKVEALPMEATSIMGWVARHRQAVRIPDLREPPWDSLYYPLDASLEMRSELAVPLISASGRLEGVLNLESPKDGAFSESDSHLLQSLATQAVIAIQEALLLDALQEVARLLLSHPCQQVLDRLVELACDLLNAADSSIWILKGDQLILQASSTPGLHANRIPINHSLAGQAILTLHPIASEDLGKEPGFFQPELADAQGWKRALVAPLITGDRDEPVGVFNVYSLGLEPERLAGEGWDTKVLSCLAHYAALAVQNASRQEALRTAQERTAVAETFAAVGDIAANLLHRLNNQVGSIPVRIQGIQEKCAPALRSDPYLRGNLAEIERSAGQAMETVRENLLPLGPIQKESMSLVDCVAAAAQAAHLPPAIKVQIEGLEHLPELISSERSLALVFTNLLENASDAMQGQGLVRIQGSLSEEWVEVNISDNGPGISPEQHEMIFELNYSSPALTRPGKLGFGLWWVKTVMARLGGSIWVESDGVHGTTFHLRLPVE